MTTFPSYRPTSLPLQHGTFPASVQQTASGRTAIVRHSELETDIILPLEFILTQAQFLVVWEHHRDHGTFLSFPLPSTIPASYTPTGYRWKYASEPVQVRDEYTNFFRVTCTFVGNLWADIRLPSELGTLEMVAVETAIANVRTTAPAAPTATVQGLASGVTSDGFVEVGGLEVGTTWEYSTNSGSTWAPGTGSGFQLPAGSYSAGAIRVRQTDRDANTSGAAQNPASVAVNDASSVTIVATIAAGATGTGTVTLPRWFALDRITTNRAGWFTLYSHAAGAAADVGRLRANEPAGQNLMIRDPVFSAPSTLSMNPPLPARNAETPQTNVYPWRFVNDGTTGEVVITLNYLMLSAS